jgi:hypothetical protein
LLAPFNFHFIEVLKIINTKYLYLAIKKLKIINKKMNSKKLIFKAVNACFFTYYLVITLAMAGGVSEKFRDGSGNLNQVPNEDSQFSDFYDFGWELAELIYLPLLLVICLLNLLLRRKFKQSKVK